MQHLVDGEIASNNGGWQWSAGTGSGRRPVLPHPESLDPKRAFRSQGRIHQDNGFRNSATSIRLFSTPRPAPGRRVGATISAADRRSRQGARNRSHMFRIVRAR